MPTVVTGEAFCPECAERLENTETLMVTEIVECGNCHAELEVMAVAPLALALAPDVDEDWGE